MPIIKTERRLKAIKIRVNDAEFIKLNKLKTQASLATWMRSVALQEAAIKRADPDLVRALGRIGSNLNQIAKYANTQQQLDNEILSSINRIEQLMIEVIKEHK